jgi:hypothetical protein
VTALTVRAVIGLTVSPPPREKHAGMSTIPRLSVPTHGALELLVGLALLALPFALGLGGAALVLAVSAGVVLAGLGLSGSDALSLGAHQALDQAAAAMLTGLAVAMAIAGEPAGAVLLGAAALAELLLVSGTRWTRGR